MSQQQDRSALDGLTDAALAASKISKIVAAGAKGGIYGAALENARQNKGLLIGILAVAFIIPVLFVVMLPSVIFGGTEAPTSGSDPILNDNEQIAENIIAMNTDIRDILYESYEDTMAEIGRQRASLDYSDIVDDIQGEMVYGAANLISMYCSYQGDMDYTQINMDGLHAQVAAHKSEYFYYEISHETRTVDVEHRDWHYVGGDRVEVVTIIQEDHDFTIFTVLYRGDSYFRDTIWQLSDTQNELATDYAANLTVYLYDLKETAAGNILDLILQITDGDVTPSPTGDWIDPFGDPNWRSHISSRFGKRNDVGLPGKDTTDHGGLDIAYPKGTTVHAVQSGTVIIAQYNSSYGNYVVINHGGGISTLYAHASELLVSAGDTVSQGQAISKVGSTGDSTGNHLHIEFIVNGVRTDPENYLP